MAALVTTLSLVAQRLDLSLHPARGHRAEGATQLTLHFVPSAQHPKAVLEGEDNPLHSCLRQASCLQRSTSCMISPHLKKKKTQNKPAPSSLLSAFGSSLYPLLLHVLPCRHLRSRTGHQSQHQDLLSLGCLPLVGLNRNLELLFPGAPTAQEYLHCVRQTHLA